MSTLKTYKYPGDMDIIAYGSTNRPAVRCLPGDWVCTKFNSDSLGLLVANGDDFLLVLWSRPPERLRFFPDAEFGVATDRD